MTLLQQRDRMRRQRRLTVLEETRRALRVALTDLMPGGKVVLFGSITQPGVFNDRSDVDVALEKEPIGLDVIRLTAELTERLGRAVDVVLLPQCRFRQKILREGEVWTL